MPWGTRTPTQIRRVEHLVGTSMDTVVVMTEVGAGYLKALGKKQGEHALACELIGSSLAAWLGLTTLEFTFFEVPAGDPIVWLEDGEATQAKVRRSARPGPGFMTRAIDAVTWDGMPDSLARCVNLDTIARLVLLDTWIANPDRHPRRPVDPSLSTWRKENLDNVMLATLRKGRRRIVAMDFSVCLHCRGGGLQDSFAVDWSGTTASTACSRPSKRMSRQEVWRRSTIDCATRRVCANILWRSSNESPTSGRSTVWCAMPCRASSPLGQAIWPTTSRSTWSASSHRPLARPILQPFTGSP